jgi:hypothetical protein
MIRVTREATPADYPAIAAVTVAAGLAGWLALGGLDGIRQVVSLRGAAGWEPD